MMLTPSNFIKIITDFGEKMKFTSENSPEISFMYATHGAANPTNHACTVFFFLVHAVKFLFNRAWQVC